MNLALMKHAKDYIEKMANGINPLTNESVPDNDLINNIRISRCLFYINNILGEIINNGGIINKNTPKLPFHLTREEIKKYEYQNEDLSITKIVGKLNKLSQNPNMINLKVTEACNWLVSIGLLKEVEKNGRKIKLPTASGEKIGMYTEHRTKETSEYDIVLYKKSAQEFILDNLPSLLEFIKIKK